MEFEQPPTQILASNEPEIVPPSVSFVVKNQSSSTLPRGPSCGQCLSSSLHYLAISLGLTIMVTLNLALLIWLLTQLNLAVNHHHVDQSWSPSHLHLIGSILIDGHLNLDRISSPMDSELMMKSASGLIMGNRIGVDHFRGYHDWSVSASHLLLTPKNIQALVDSHLTIRSSKDDRLLLLLDNGSESKIFLDEVEIRSIPSVQNRIISIKNGSAQMNQINGTNHQLTITSYTNRILLHGTRHISMMPGKSVTMASREALKIRSSNGKLLLNATAIHLDKRGVRTVVATRQGRTYLTVAQLCLCANTGRLFMAPADSSINYSQQQLYQCHQLASIQCSSK